jgi:hypothetical protein
LSAGLEDSEDFLVWQEEMVGITRGRVQVDLHDRSRDKVNATTRHGTNAQLGALKVSENPDRALEICFDRADHRHIVRKPGMIRMAHVDAEHVSTSLEQLAYGGRVPGGRSQGGNNFYIPAPAHFLSLVSVLSLEP